MNNIYRLLVSVALLPISMVSISGEVDNYYAWGKPIKDSRLAFNRYLNQQIEKSLVAINEAGKLQQCQQVSLQIMKDLGAQRYPLKYRGALNADMEYWAQESDSVDRVPGVETSLDEYAKNSIYAPAMRTAGIKTDLDHIVNVGGVYFGTDKISHFLGSGYEYYKRYLKATKQDSVAYAQAKSVLWATGMEGGLLGIKVVGVYSYADLEANYQGFEMARNLCQLAHLRFDKQWRLHRSVKMQDYVNPNWDESFYISTYSKGRLKKVKKNIANSDLCRLKDSTWAIEQNANYWLWPTNGAMNLGSTFNTSFSAHLLTVAQHYKYKTIKEDDTLLDKHLIELALNREQFSYFLKRAKVPPQEAFRLAGLCHNE